MTDPSIATARRYVCHCTITDQDGRPAYTVDAPTQIEVRAATADHARRIAEHKLRELGLQGQVTQVVRQDALTTGEPA